MLAGELISAERVNLGQLKVVRDLLRARKHRPRFATSKILLIL